jgi:hypothetical protein
MHTANRSPIGLPRHRSIPIVTRLATLTALSTLTRLLALTPFQLDPTVITLWSEQSLIGPQILLREKELPLSVLEVDLELRCIGFPRKEAYKQVDEKHECEEYAGYDTGEEKCIGWRRGQVGGVVRLHSRGVLGFLGKFCSEKELLG